MAVEKGKLQLERFAYTQFKRMWRDGKFNGQRYGQAFYNHFKMHRLADQDQLHGLYEADGDHAGQIIDRVFRFN